MFRVAQALNGTEDQAQFAQFATVKIGACAARGRLGGVQPDSTIRHQNPVNISNPRRWQAIHCQPLLALR